MGIDVVDTCLGFHVVLLQNQLYLNFYGLFIRIHFVSQDFVG